MSMLTILLHSSKTMRPAATESLPYRAPQLIAQARELAAYTQSLSVDELANCMKLSTQKAEATQVLLQKWHARPDGSRPAIDAFLGDVYSGLQVASFTVSDREYANAHLLILSGLYGGLRALDSILPYRLEMGYHLPSKEYKNLYQFWGDSIARTIPKETKTVVNLSAVEYTKAVLPYVDMPVVAPKFLTRNPAANEPTFVTVHAKIARGAFAHWMIINRVDSAEQLTGFNELGYAYDASRSTSDVPVFVCDEFGGIGLSVRKS